MKSNVLILAFGLSVLFLCGCTESEVVTSYEEVQEATEPIPVSFSTYVGDMAEGNATTRASLDYFIFYHSNSGQKIYKNIPFLGENRNNLQIGHAAYNNYIVGVYGFWHPGSSWGATDKTSTSFKADFMTNQPLLHLWDEDHENAHPYWYYTPIKYWPNSNRKEIDGGYSVSQDKVTFISYYPFQDFSPYDKDGNLLDENDNIINVAIDDETKPKYEYYRNGTDNPRALENKSSTKRIPKNGINNYLNDSKTIDNIKYTTISSDKNDVDNNDLTNIVPPSKDATGIGAYTFEFRQKQKVEDHIDFMIGMNEYTPTNSINQNVTLNLRHALCAIFFICDFKDPTKDDKGNAYDEVPSYVNWKVNKITITGLKDHGTVIPDISNDLTKYTWNFLPTSNPSVCDYVIEYDNTIFPQGIYNVTKKDGKYSSTWAGENKRKQWGVYNDGNGKGYKWIILALPQTTSDQCEVIVDYDLTYKYADKDLTVKYENCIDKKTISGVNLIGGKVMDFYLSFYLRDITMDAVVMEWPDDEYLDIEGDINIGS